MLLILIIFLAAVIVTVAIMSNAPKIDKGDEIYFDIIDDIHHEKTDSEIIEMLKKKHQLSDNDASAALIAAHDHNDEWFYKFN